MELLPLGTVVMITGPRQLETNYLYSILAISRLGLGF